MANPWRSISAADRNMASGLATPVPAMSGAEPCTGSNTPGVGGSGSPREALGQLPTQPAGIAAPPGRGHQAHGGVVDQQVLELDMGEFVAVHLPDDLAPEAAGLQDVGLVDAGDP